MKKVKARGKGWAQSRADRIDPEAAREILARHAAKTAAQQVVGARLDREAVDKILQNHYLVLPSRQQLFGVVGKQPVVKAGPARARGAHATISGAIVGSYDENPGNARRPVGRPRIERERSTGRAAMVKRRLRFAGTQQPAGVSAIDWGMLHLSYVDGIGAPEIAERFNLRPEVVRKRLSRARQAAALPK